MRPLLWPVSPPAAALGVVPGLNPKERERIGRMLAANREALRSMPDWREIGSPEMDAAMREALAGLPAADSLETKLSGKQAFPGLSAKDTAWMPRWEAAVGRARAVYAEQTRPTITAGEAVRLLAIARTAKAAVGQAIGRAALPEATDQDRAAVAALGGCSDAIVRSAGPVDALIVKLGRAVDAGRGAHVTTAEAAALEAFGQCAFNLPPPKGAVPAGPVKPKGGVAEAVVGTGLPAIGSLLVALLRA
jgi:hypothetical protein